MKSFYFVLDSLKFSFDFLFWGYLDRFWLGLMRFIVVLMIPKYLAHIHKVVACPFDVGDSSSCPGWKSSPIWDDGALVAEGKEDDLSCLCVYVEKTHITASHVSSAKASPMVLAKALTRKQRAFYRKMQSTLEKVDTGWIMSAPFPRPPSQRYDGILTSKWLYLEIVFTDVFKFKCNH